MVDEGRRLDVRSKEWEGAMRSVKEAMGGMAPSESCIHISDQRYRQQSLASCQVKRGLD